MTAVEAQEFADYMVERETERAERPVLHRQFAAELIRGDGRTVDVRIVPYRERITHTDGLGGVPRGTPYGEEFMPGVFAGQEKAANRVLVNIEHEQGIAGVVGHGMTLREGADGFYGSFRIHETPDGDKALLLVNEKVFDTVSLEAQPIKSVRNSEGVVQRVKAHLRNIALTRFGAYQGAVVLAVREQTIIDEVPPPPDLDPELAERVRKLGIQLPDRYQAHPDEPDTSADADTSEDGTRQPEQTATTEDNTE